MCGICGIFVDEIGRDEFDGFINLLLHNEKRGTDATGIYYQHRVLKLPVKASVFVEELYDIIYNLVCNSGSKVLLGHTRLSTTGSPFENKNNHPWKIGKWVFAHNGVAHVFHWQYYEFHVQNVSSNLPEWADEGVVTDSYRHLFVPLYRLIRNGRNVKEAVEKVVNERDRRVSGAFWLFDEENGILYVVNINGDMTYHVSADKFLFSSEGLSEVLGAGEMIVVREGEEISVKKEKLDIEVPIRRVRRLSRGSVRQKGEWKTWGWHEWEA